jgi:hypothetical protein
MNDSGRGEREEHQPAKSLEIHDRLKRDHFSIIDFDDGVRKKKGVFYYQESRPRCLPRPGKRPSWKHLRRPCRKKAFPKRR